MDMFKIERSWNAKSLVDFSEVNGLPNIRLWTNKEDIQKALIDEDVFAYIAKIPHEKEKQSIILDLDMGANIAAAARTDAIEDTLNYKAVAKRLIEYVGDSDFQLVETLAERVAGIVLNEFDVPWI